MSLFFNVSIEEVNFIKTSFEIMPTFLSNIHD